MLKKLNDFSLGFIAIIFIVAVGYFAINDFSKMPRNKYYAQFESINGINKATTVYMHGVKIGRVSDIKLKDGFAQVEVSIDRKIKIPVDSTLLVATTDIFSASIMSVSPGFEEEYMTNKQSFYLVQNSVNFLGLLNEYLDSKIEQKRQGE